MFILYNIMVFLTGFLILNVQLIFGKSILPVFGGSPNVWLTSLAFYQVVLTLGYLYSYIIQKKLKLKTQIILHSILFLCSLVFIPVSMNIDYINVFKSESLNLFITIFLSIGIPYFLLTASSPLIQSWFGHSNLKKSHNPYVLYVASNLGTFLSLISYPFLIEIFFSIKEQFYIWSSLFILEIILILICGFFLFKNVIKNTVTNVEESVSTIKKSNIFVWIIIGFIPSCFLSVITNKITIDIAPIPLLWIIPLGIYFLSFSIAFSEKFKKFKLFNQASLLFTIILFFIHISSLPNVYLVIFCLLSLFFVSTTFHRYLYQNAPDKKHLTLFYLFMSVGGALGGTFVGVISPLIFNNYTEFYIIIFMICISTLQFTKTKNIQYNYKQNIAYFIPFIFIFSLGIYKKYDTNFISLYQERTFFGLNKVSESNLLHNNIDYNIKKLTHGTTLHGAQIMKPKNLSKQTLTYYSKNNPIYLSIKDYDDNYNFSDIGIIGLGTGAMNCMFENKNIDFFEIDQEIINIAKNHFSYLDICKNKQNFLLGDARIKIKNINDNKYDIIVIDAFSSDAIPVHLITEEAISLYRNKLKDNGLLVFHISNRYLNLEPVLGNIAKKINTESKLCYMKEKRGEIYAASSQVVIMSDNMDFINESCWKKTKTDNNNTWNDNYSNIFKYMIFH